MRRLLSIVWNFKERRMRCLCRLSLQLVGMLLALFAVFIPLSLLMMSLDLDVQAPSMLPVLGVAQAFTIALSVFAAVWLLDRRRPQAESDDLGFAKWRWNELVGGLILGAAAMMLIFVVELNLGWIEIRHIGPRHGMELLELLPLQLGWLLMMLAVGFSEELLSRGYHLKNLSEGLRGWGVWPAVGVAALLSSLFFGLLHAANDNATWVSCLGVALAGLALAIGRIATGSLAAPIGLHVSWNLFQGPVLGFPVSGNALPGSLVVLTQRGEPLWTGGAFGPEAGLIGIVAVLALGLLFVVWGLRKSPSRRYAAALARYRAPLQPTDKARLSSPSSFH